MQVIRVRLARSNRPEQYIQGDLIPADGVRIEDAFYQLQSLAGDLSRHRSTSMQVSLETVNPPPQLTPVETELLTLIRNSLIPTPEEIETLVALRNGTAKLMAAKPAKEAKPKAAKKAKPAKAPKKSKATKKVKADAAEDTQGGSEIE